MEPDYWGGGARPPEPIKHTKLKCYYPVEFCLGIRLGSASVCYNNYQQAFLGQLQDLSSYVLEHAMSNLL